MNDKVADITKKILKYIGGEENISTFEHCITRLRINIVDINKVDFESLNEMEEVMALIRLENQIQVVLGPSMAGKVGDKIEEGLYRKKKEIKFSRLMVSILRDIGYIFAPIIPGIIGCGLMIGILNLLSSFNIFVDFNIYRYVDLLSESIYLYMPVFVGISGAKYYGLSYIIGGLLGTLGILLNFDLSILALIFTIKVLSIMEKKIRMSVTEYLETLVNPLILLLSGFFILNRFNFIGIYIVDGLEAIILYFMNINKSITGFIIGASFLPIISLGLHHSLLPLNIHIMRKGLNNIWPILVMAGAGQIGVSSYIYLHEVDGKTREDIKRGLFFGLLGIGELLIYKVTKENKERFIISCIAAGIGGAFISYYGVSSRALVLAGWPLLVAIEVNNMKYYIFGLLISNISGYILMAIKSFFHNK